METNYDTTDYDENNKTNYDRDNNDILNREDPLTPGQSIAENFEFSQESADKGGMGTVIFCRYKRDKTFYALKTFKDSNINKELFYKEAEFCLSLQKHPHIVHTKTIAAEKGKIYIVMELLAPQPADLTEKVQSRTLNKYLKTLDSKTALKYAVEICRGMQYLSSLKGFISHNDIKPQNIFITTDGHAKIGDFGLQSLKGGKGGTLGYRPPEFFTNKPFDIRSDIYSFGIVLYQMFNGGALPFKDNTFPTQKQQGHKLLDITKIEHSYCGGIIEKCLQQKPENRYQNFKELEQDLSAQAKQINSEVKTMPTAENDYFDWFYKGLGYYNLNKHQNAIDNYNKALALYPNDCVAYNNKANSEFCLKLYKQAIDSYTQSLKFNREYKIAYVGRAKVYLLCLRDYEKAIADYTRAIKYGFKVPFVYNNRGVAETHLGKFDSAIKDYTKAIELDKNYIKAYRNRADVYMLMGNAYRNRADVYMSTRNFKKALDDYTFILKVTDNDADVFANWNTVKKMLNKGKAPNAD